MKKTQKWFSLATSNPNITRKSKKKPSNKIVCWSVILFFSQSLSISFFLSLPSVV